MKGIFTKVLLVSLFSVSFSLAQDKKQFLLRLKNGSFVPEKNVSSAKVNQFNSRLISFHKKSFVIIQFEKMPSEADRKQLQQDGIELLDYVPDNAYTATLTGRLNEATLKKAGARSVISLSASQKMQTTLANGIVPSHAEKVNGFADVWVSFAKSYTTEEVLEALRKDGYEILSNTYQAYQIIELRLAKERLTELAELPYIQYIQPIPREAQPFNNHSTVNGRANLLNFPQNGNLGLKGEGVVVGVGDDSNPMQHIDYASRIINRNPTMAGSHGVHVMGTLGGAGIVREKLAGYAPKVKMISQLSSNILNFTSMYVQDFNMVITNNSYGYGNSDCSNFGDYDLISYILDQQTIQLPYLQHVFAAGNSGRTSCGSFLPGFANVLGGYQSAKNVISVGNANRDGIVNIGSSKGPVSDGRIKPEISAQGTDVMSTVPLNSYWVGTGTSFASPAVAGGLALLYQKYRQLHGGSDPRNGLMKAILVNGSSDKGNDGPDYQYGYGWMNLVRSVKMLEAENHRTGVIVPGVKDVYDIQVPANTGAVKVMLYWNDPAASILASKTLVNDLDLTLESPAKTITLPMILDAAGQNVNNVATTGADHVNNIEQTVITNPAAGTYKINVNATALNQGGSQEYFIVYDIIPAGTTLTYPVGKERLSPGDDINVSWDAYGTPGDNYTAEYSVNDGASWASIPGSPAVKKSLLGWIVPDVATDKARVRVTNNGVTSTSAAFTILRAPQIQLSAIQCEGYIAIDWAAVAGATDYEVMLLKGDEMVPVGLTAGTSYAIGGLAKEETYWFSVRARMNGSAGPRADALPRQPNSGNCSGTISDNDHKLDAIMSPVSSGRVFTATALSAATPVTIRIKNLDDQVSNGNVTVSYSINGGTLRSHTVPLTIPASSFVDYSFPETEDFSAIGVYNLLATVKKPGDPVAENDTLRKTFKQVSNVAIILPFIDNVEAAAEQSKVAGVIGLDQVDRYDFTNSSPAGRVRTFVNSGMAWSGSKAFTLDTDRYFPSENTNFLDGTFNLEGYTLDDDIRLFFYYKNYGQLSHPDNKVWVRGSYTDPWLPVFDLFAHQNPVEQSYKLSSSIELSHVLRDNGQALTKATQVRWGQHGNNITADPFSGAGYGIDDITLRIDTDDVQMISINSITETSCGLSAQQPVVISIRNSSDRAVNNVPVKYRFNGNVVSEIIPLINARETIQYEFGPKLDLAALGLYHIEVWSDLETDTFTENNAINLTFYNNALVSDFPYLENFENGNGNWHSAGMNNTWAYGTPASNKINRAASGTKAWKTNLYGNYSNQEASYLYSPCFNISGMTNPTLSLSLALDLEFCPNEDCDMAFMEYSIDGNNWIRLGTSGEGTNWYNKVRAGKQGWSVQDYTRWHVGTMKLPVVNGNIRLRFVMKADPATSREGIAIDDIHIYDNNAGIYDGGTTLTAVTQEAAKSSGWIDFKQNGKLVASIHPNGQDFSNTSVQAFINTGTVRNDGKQYYMDRNITIKPVTANFASDATVRLYFLDSESEKLISAGGCANCTTIKTAYALGISKYTDADKSKEDGSIANNNTGVWSFLTSANTVKVPFDKGYYAEIRVKDFSEFWFNNGGVNGTTPLPVELVSFTAQKSPDFENPDDVVIRWATTSEVNADRFELERSTGVTDFKLNRFFRIGEVPATGNSSAKSEYSFFDKESGKSGEYYYRLKIVDRDGSFKYSQVRSVTYDLVADWQVYPNPSDGKFHVLFQAGKEAAVAIQILAQSGTIVHQKIVKASGLKERYPVDLSGDTIPAGLYIVEVTSQDQKKVFRVVKL